ncbi:trichohyalin, putative [Entamoeba histolytica]
MSKEDGIKFVEGVNDTTKSTVCQGEEINKLEGWTKRKVGDVIFDSDIDDWNKNTSTFDQKIINKEHLIIIIEIEEGNKLGGYINERIEKIGSYINDPTSFIFLLNPNEMKKFSISHSPHTFYLASQSDDRLFSIGNGLSIYKGNNKSMSHYAKSSFREDSLPNAVCIKPRLTYFTPQRIVVVQMI